MLTLFEAFPGECTLASVGFPLSPVILVQGDAGSFVLRNKKKDTRGERDNGRQTTREAGD